MIGGDDGAGSVLAIGLVATAAMLTVAVLGAGAALTARQRIVGAADAAALAAADGASGAVAGEPCALADRVAAANRAALTVCSLDGLIATVAVSGSAAGLPVTVRSTAGPPP